MFTLNKYLIMSSLCHAVLFAVVINTHHALPEERLSGSGAFEIEIISRVPPGGQTRPGDAPVNQDEKPIRKELPHAGSMEKAAGELALNEAPSRFPETDISMESPEGDRDIQKLHRPTMPDMPIVNNSSQSDSKGETPSEITLWKEKIKSTVETIWEAPQELNDKNTAMQTTYIFRVNKAGVLLNTKSLIPSDNDIFDQSILRILKTITGFAPPPLILTADDEWVWVKVTMASAPMGRLSVSVDISKP